jgi:hypothetical protein
MEILKVVQIELNETDKHKQPIVEVFQTACKNFETDSVMSTKTRNVTRTTRNVWLRIDTAVSPSYHPSHLRKGSKCSSRMEIGGEENVTPSLFLRPSRMMN